MRRLALGRGGHTRNSERAQPRKFPSFRRTNRCALLRFSRAQLLYNALVYISHSNPNPHIKQNLMCVCVCMLTDAHALTLFLCLTHAHTTQVLVLGAWWQVCLASSANASLCKVDSIRLNTKIEIFCSVFKSVKPPQNETTRHALFLSLLSLFSVSLALSLSRSISLSLTHTHTHTHTNTDLTEIEICSLIMCQHARGGDAGDCGSRTKCATGKGTLFC